MAYTLCRVQLIDCVSPTCGIVAHVGQAMRQHVRGGACIRFVEGHGDVGGFFYIPTLCQSIVVYEKVCLLCAVYCLAADVFVIVCCMQLAAALLSSFSRLCSHVVGVACPWAVGHDRLVLVA